MKNTNTKLTYFDTLVTDRTLQLAKAVIPYIGKREGGLIAVYVKFMELQNAMKYARSPKLCGSLSAKETDKPQPDMMGLFSELKDFLDDDMAESFEMMMSLMEMMKENPEASEDMFGNYMNMFKDMM